MPVQKKVWKLIEGTSYLKNIIEQQYGRLWFIKLYYENKLCGGG